MTSAWIANPSSFDLLKVNRTATSITSPLKSHQFPWFRANGDSGSRSVFPPSHTHKCAAEEGTCTLFFRGKKWLWKSQTHESGKCGFFEGFGSSVSRFGFKLHVARFEKKLRFPLRRGGEMIKNQGWSEGCHYHKKATKSLQKKKDRFGFHPFSVRLNIRTHALWIYETWNTFFPALLPPPFLSLLPRQIRITYTYSV